MAPDHRSHENYKVWSPFSLKITNLQCVSINFAASNSMLAYIFLYNYLARPKDDLSLDKRSLTRDFLFSRDLLLDFLLRSFERLRARLLLRSLDRDLLRSLLRLRRFLSFFFSLDRFLSLKYRFIVQTILYSHKG